jgi:tetratricopeptide (TPR) repeat protein
MAQRLGRSLYYARRYREAIEQYRNALALDPNFRLAQWGLGTTYLTQNMYAHSSAAQLAHSSAGRTRAHDVARISIGLGEKDHAFEWLDKPVNQKEGYLYLQADPVYDSLRSDARFTDLLRRMRLI